MSTSEPSEGSTSGSASARREGAVLAELAEVVHLVTERPASEVQPGRTFVDDLRIDSLEMVEILEGTSRRLGVRIDDEDAKYFVRVEDLVGYLDARVR